MKNRIKIFIVSMVISTVTGCQTPSLVNTKILSENGSPIENVKVDVRYLGYDHWEKETDSGLTDKNGEFRSSGVAKLRIHVFVSKEGYYDSESGRLNRKENHDVELTLREKKKPTPLYAKAVGLRLPVNRRWVSYDFEVGDWVPPHGRGKVSDVYFKCDTEVTGYKDGKGTLEMKFNDDEGLILVKENYLPLSEMKMPHKAPLEGYGPLLYREEESFRNKNRQLHVGYFLRTRVVKEGNEIISAHYGKILEDIKFYPVLTQFKNEKGEGY